VKFIEKAIELGCLTEEEHNYIKELADKGPEGAVELSEIHSCLMKAKQVKLLRRVFTGETLKALIENVNAAHEDPTHPLAKHWEKENEK
jgi:hypothetical protein